MPWWPILCIARATTTAHAQAPPTLDAPTSLSAATPPSLTARPWSATPSSQCRGRPGADLQNSPSTSVRQSTRDIFNTDANMFLSPSSNRHCLSPSASLFSALSNSMRVLKFSPLVFCRWVFRLLPQHPVPHLQRLLPQPPHLPPFDGRHSYPPARPPGLPRLRLLPGPAGSSLLRVSPRLPLRQQLKDLRAEGHPPAAGTAGSQMTRGTKLQRGSPRQQFVEKFFQPGDKLSLTKKIFRGMILERVKMTQKRKKTHEIVPFATEECSLSAWHNRFHQLKVSESD